MRKRLSSRVLSLVVHNEKKRQELLHMESLSENDQEKTDDVSLVPSQVLRTGIFQNIGFQSLFLSIALNHFFEQTFRFIETIARDVGDGIDANSHRINSR